MTRIKITKSHSLDILPVEIIGVAKAVIPVDGEFHEIDDVLLPVLDHAGIEYEIENADAAGEQVAAGGAAGLGGSASPPSRKRKSPAKPKAKAKKAKK